MKLVQKLKGKQGVTMAEVLLALLLVGLMLLFLGGGTTVLQDAYYKITLRAEAQTLLSTVATSVSEELRNADNIVVNNESERNVISFFSTKRGYDISLINRDNMIYIKAGSTEEEQEVPLSSKKSMTNGLNVRLEDLTYEDHVLSYTIAIHQNDSNYIEQTIKIRPMNEKE